LFKPIPPTPWTSPLSAKLLGFTCATYPDFLYPDAKEDCLTLNLIKPAKPSSNPTGYPVMVFIHGGAFSIGSSADMNHTEIAERMVTKGIIFISINYRLGPFGFFSTGNSDAPGNYGLWDQIQDLKFIQKIIGNFGGNSKAITIFGESAGGASVSWLTLTPEAKDLFARAILMSGSALAPYAHTDQVVATSEKLIETSGCKGSANIKKCLKQKSMTEIKEATAKFGKYMAKADLVNTLHFHPRTDKELLHGLSVEEAIKNADKKEHLIGICSLEFVVAAVNNEFGNPEAKYVPIPATKATNFTREDFVETVRIIFGTKEAYDEKAEEAAEDIIKFYESQISFYQRNPYIHIYAQLFSDITFNIPAIREAQLKANAGQKVYFYVYSFTPDFSKHHIFDGAGHASELSNLFGALPIYNIPAHPLEGDVAKVQKTMTDLFINFAKTGKPTTDILEVPPLNTPNKTPYIDINAKIQIKENLWEDRIGFWEKHSKKFGFDWFENRKIVIRDEL
jgi:carboxylesterase type B